MVMTILSLACGAGFGAGLIVLVHTLTSSKRIDPGQQRGGTPSALSVVASRRSLTPRIALGIVLAIVVGILTKWPAAMIIAAVTGFGLQALLRLTSHSKTISRTEAIAVWTELLRDTLAAASGLSQAIVATAAVAPVPIRDEVGTLASHLSNGMSMSDALHQFAVQLSDPSADLVVCALILASTARAQRLVDLLGALADSMREEIAMRLKVESGRASARSGVRTIVLFSIGFAAMLSLLAHSYLQPFGTPGGQIVLLIAGSCDIAGIILMLRLVRDVDPPRLLLSNPTVSDPR